tara:strand:+ start:1139 stop:1348 length:210 start_codon:yes stop_codon:yes gene_type:complete
MSGSKMQMRLYTNNSSIQSQNKIVQQNIVRSLQNQKSSYIKLGFSGTKRNCAALIVQGQKYCKSCNDKK